MYLYSGFAKRQLAAHWSGKQSYLKLSGLPLVLLYSFMRSFSTFCKYFSMFSHSLTGGIHLDFARNGSSFCFEGCVAK